MSGYFINATVEGGQQLSDALKGLPRAMANKIVKKAIRQGAKLVMAAQKQGIPSGRLARGHKRISYDESGKPHIRLAGYMARAITVRKKQGRARPGSYTDVVQFNARRYPLLVSHSVGDQHKAKKSEVLERIFSEKSWKMIVKRRTHGYKAGRRAYFYPASVEYGFTTRGGGKASGKRYLRKIATQKAQTAFAAIGAEIGWGIEDHVKAVTQ